MLKNSIILTIIPLVLLLFYCSESDNATVSVDGYITDAITGDSLSGVYVGLSRGTLGGNYRLVDHTVTGSTGYYCLGDMLNTDGGRYFTVIATKKGYNDTTISESDDLGFLIFNWGAERINIVLFPEENIQQY